MRLTVEDANARIIMAWEMSKHHGLRFGQALWNDLPKELCKLHVGTQRDIFFVEDTDKVLELFWLFYVNIKEF